MTELRRRATIAIIAHTILYVGLRVVMAVDSGFDFPYDLGLIWLVWIVWAGWFAAGDTLAVISGWRARRRPAAQPISLAGYMPGATIPPADVNRAA